MTPAEAIAVLVAYSGVKDTEAAAVDAAADPAYRADLYRRARRRHLRPDDDVGALLVEARDLLDTAGVAGGTPSAAQHVVQGEQMVVIVDGDGNTIPDPDA